MTKLSFIQALALITSAGMLFLTAPNHSEAASSGKGSAGSRPTQATKSTEPTGPVRDHRVPTYGWKKKGTAPQGNTSVIPTQGYRPGQKSVPTKVQVAPKGTRTDGKVTDHRNPPKGSRGQKK